MLLRRILLFLSCCALFVVGCSKEEPPEAPKSEVPTISSVESTPSETTPKQKPRDSSRVAQDAQFDRYAQKLAQAKAAERKPGQTILSGQSLVFDQDQGYAEMKTAVEVLDDQGLLCAEHLLGRFNVSNQIETVTAQGNVSMRSQGRTAECAEALYDYTAGTILLEGRAVVSDGTNSLSGQQIQLWNGENRRMVCEPNALLVLKGESGEEIEGFGRTEFDTEIRANRITYDELEQRADVVGDVRVRDAQGSMTCDQVAVYLSASNRVNSVEALGNVALDSQGRTASGEKATYEYAEGLILLEGMASVSDGTNTLSGERIRFWSGTNRKVICEPNALLVVSGETAPSAEGDAGQKFDTEIRAGRIVYDEEQHRAELIGNVRVRDVQGAMNCNEVTLYLKGDNKIDWIEARGAVIIQSEERKALAELVVYTAEEGKFTLTGNPMVKQEANIMAGDQILFWPETQQMICEPNARAVLYLDEETKAKFMKDLND
jgi:lipopolysaccharide transport protein LptA